MKTVINHIKNQQGLSLIELMIAVLLGIFITGGMIQLFTNSKQSYRVQENLSRLQENGRFAMDFLSLDIRRADYWGCLNSSVSIANNLNGSGFDGFANAIIATDNDGLNGSDSITIKMVAPSEIYVKKVPATVAAVLQVTINSGLKNNDIILVSDCSEGNIFQITNFNPNSGGFDNVGHNTGGSPTPGDPEYPGNKDKDLSKKYGTDAQVYKMAYLTYSIAEGQSGQPALFRSNNGAAAQELVEGIENMQILYGIDTDADDTPNFYSPSTGLSQDQLNQAVSVRISLLATTLEDNLSTQAVPYTIFGTTTTPPSTDRKFRRVFSSTIAVRNRLP